MRLVSTTHSFCVALVLGSIAIGPVLAASLSGQEGQVRRKIMFTMDMVGGCSDMWQRYVKASGHSAYAATPTYAEAFICGATFNAKSKQAAEKQALAQCNAGLKRYKVHAVQLCELAASK